MVKKGSVLVYFLVFLVSVSAYTQDANKQDEDVQLIKKRGYSLETCYKQAEDFLRTGNEQFKAIPYLEYIIESDRFAKPKVFYLLAQAYYYSGKFDRAVDALNEFLKKEKKGNLVKEAKLELERYKSAQRTASGPLNAILVNLGPTINSKYAEVNPYISKFEDLLVYSSNRHKNFNIYVSKKDFIETIWSNPKLAGDYVNSQNDEFVAGLSPTGKNLMVHYNQVSGFEDINISIREKGLYRELENPGIKINTTYREEGACMTEDGDTLYFASDRPGGFGGFDLYYSLRLPEGTYGTPINMGSDINTPKDENYPNLSPDGKTFYFASKGHNSIGGYDIFRTSFDPISRKWNIPANLGFPINNAFDNKSITFSNDPRYAYISTIDNRTQGDYDIYKVIFLDVEPGYLVVKAEIFVNENDSIIPLNKFDDELSITVYQDDQVFGNYSFDRRNNTFVMAFIPGTYIFEIDSENYKPYRRKITINENYYINNLRTLKITLDKNRGN